MPLIRNLLFHAARRAMNDERFRQKASETLEKEIKPRIDAALSKAKPRVDETREDIKNIAAETKPLENPAKFTGRVTRRILDKLKK
ncbi:MAG: hypothetical protein CMM37_03815 [Rhodospirillaceae bacterium]|jgi:hypothetical protein|nr:hypothetical protein [Rhodospirillaceae bacterium]